MSFEQDSKTEELLNCYLDDELSSEQQEQVQRLIDQDEAVARRLSELQQCKTLVSALPPAEPPAEVVSAIRQLVQDSSAGEKARLGHIDRQRGKRHLFARHALAAAVLIGLFGLLGAVIYRIAGPQGEGGRYVVSQPQPAVKPAVIARETAMPVGDTTGPAGVQFYSLQLKTSDFTGVDAFVNKLLDENPSLRYEATKEQTGRSTYRVLCSRSVLEALVNDLSTVWARFDSATLFVQTGDIRDCVAVEAVQPEQITEISNQQTLEGRMRLAKDFAVINNLQENMPARRMLALAEGDYQELPAIPKPVLTSGEKKTIEPGEDDSEQVRVDLAIVVSEKD